MRFKWVRVTLAAALIAGGCSAAVAQTLRWGSAADFATADPHAQNDGLNNAIMRHVYEGLIGSNAKLELVPALATEWTQVSPTLWRVKLRPGVKFHDGAAFTSDDVVFSIERAQDANSAFRTYAAALGTPRKVDDLTVEFQLPRVNPLFPSHLMLVAIMNKNWATQHNSAKPLDMKNKEERYAGHNANGTGPFVLGTRQPDTRTMFKRNPAWWGTFEGNVQEVVYVPVKGDSTRVAALLSGGLDLVLDPAMQDISRLGTGLSTKVLSGPENRVIFLGMDQARDELLYSNVKGKNPFKDQRVRQALYQAIDIDTLKSRIMRGQSEPTGVVMSSKAGVFNDATLEKRLPYDVAKARALLTEAGYTDGFQCPGPINPYTEIGAQP